MAEKLLMKLSVLSGRSFCGKHVTVNFHFSRATALGGRRADGKFFKTCRPDHLAAAISAAK
ncbi:hypothetical protein DWQ65_07405 [Treponema phagedenis]|nr:hypothetical protein C5O78_00650 [Treponema phagedenis]QSH99893.1 hypothetical protein DWQ65_07405 [Treponema phagedenis]